MVVIIDCTYSEGRLSSAILELDKRTVRTLTAILTGHCEIGNFADKLGLPHQDYSCYVVN